MKKIVSTEKRKTFRHGDLRNALTAAGLEMARVGGPNAVVLREATRQAGVSPNAAYRHFANQAELLDAVRSACLSQLAAAIEVEMKSAVQDVIRKCLLERVYVRWVWDIWDSR
jgi:AcrR family transcriptional regulator